jgi:hypothetical protein
MVKVVDLVGGGWGVQSTPQEKNKHLCLAILSGWTQLSANRRLAVDGNMLVAFFSYHRLFS